MANILENAVQLSENNRTISEQILSMVRDLPEYVEPTSSSGNYVWKKSEIVKNEYEESKYVADTIITYGEGYSTPVSVYGGDSYTYDSETQLYSLTGDVTPYSVKSTQNNPANGTMVGSHKYYIVDGQSGEKMIVRNSSTSAYYMGMSVSSNKLLIGHSKESISIYSTGTVYNFLDYIVSSDPEAYPDGAVHTDGYWYERVSEYDLIKSMGFDDYLIETKVFSSDMYLSTTFEHGYGKTPSVVICIADLAEINSDYSAFIMAIASNFVVFYKSSTGVYKQMTPTSTSSTVFADTTFKITSTAYSSYKLQAGVEYKFIYATYP